MLNSIYMKRITYLLASFTLLLCACGSETKTNNDTATEDIMAGVTQSAELSMSNENINQIIKSVPSPLEITSLIKESGVTYDKDMLNKTGNSEGYVNTPKKAINLGVYGADLGYINLYEKTYTSLEYLSTIRSIADDLKLGQFFDFETLKRLSSNNNKLDSIIYISTSSFEKMNNYLAKQKRENISVLMLTGGWIEAVHLASQVAIKSNNKEMIERVGEQKIALEQIVILMDVFKNDPNFSTLYNDIKSLEKLYADVKITYEEKEPVTKEVNGMLVVESGTESHIEISEEQFQKIASSLSQIRNNIIKS